jgi:hypothetical protein
MSSDSKKTSPWRLYGSALEQEIVEAVGRSLKSPWTLQQQTIPLDLSATDVDLHYTPDFVIRNESNGHVLAVEVKSSSSLSMANVIKLQHIQNAFQESGTDFLLVVHNVDAEAKGKNAQLTEYGLNAVDINRPDQAAVEIEKQLP